MDGHLEYWYNVVYHTQMSGISFMICTSHRYETRSPVHTQFGLTDVSLQIPPFNDQANVQAVSSDIAVLLSDWVEAARRPQSGGSSARGEFPVYRIDTAIDQYLSELEPSRAETKASYEAVKRQLRRNW